MNFKVNPTPLITAVNEFRDKELLVNEDYQRNYVWKENLIKSELIRSLISEYPTGTFIFWETKNDLDYPIKEVVDGQQRITTIKEFLDGNFTLNVAVTEKMVEDLRNELKRESQIDQKAKKLLDMLNSKVFKRISIKDLPKLWTKRIDNYTLNVVTVTGEKEEITDYFSSVQNQERLKAGELINSMPENPVSDYMKKETIEKAAEILNFNDIRQDILKQLNAIMCLDSKMIRMGVVDKEIIKAVGKLEKDHISSNSRLSNIFDSFINDVSISNSISTQTLRVFGLKLLILTYFYLDNVDFMKLDLSKKSEIISKVAEYSGYFNSKDIDRKDDIPSEIRDEIQGIWTISKTTHGKEDVKQIIVNELNNVINYIMSN